MTRLSREQTRTKQNGRRDKKDCSDRTTGSTRTGGQIGYGGHINRVANAAVANGPTTTGRQPGSSAFWRLVPFGRPSPGSPRRVETMSGRSFTRAFVVRTRRRLLRGLATRPPNLTASRGHGWHTEMFAKATDKLKRMHTMWKNKRRMISQDSKRKKQLELKILAEYLFKDKKCNFERDARCLFLNDRLNSSEKRLKTSFMRTLDYEKYVYGVRVVKFDRNGYKRRTRLLILTNGSLCLTRILENKLKPKEMIPLGFVRKLEVTSGTDDFLLVKISPQCKRSKGDLILEVPYLIEFVTKLIDTSKNRELLNINGLGVDQKLLSHDIRGSKSGVIELKKSCSTPSIVKGKNKNLIVSG